MALKLNERYPGRFNSPTTQYPQGSFKNRTAPGAKDGSYLEQDWANDKLAFYSSLLSGANITANGNVDTVGASQHYDALLLNTQRGVIGISRNARMSVIAESATATFTADELIVQTALGGRQYKLSSFSNIINLASTGAGGMDTGTVPVTGFVALYAIYNPTTLASGLLAVNATSAVVPEVCAGVMPSGYTASALVSVLRISGSKFTICEQSGRVVSIQDFSALSATSAIPTATRLSIAGVVPLNARKVSGTLYSGLPNQRAGGYTRIDIYSNAQLVGKQSCRLGIGYIGDVYCNYELPISNQGIYYTTSSISGLLAAGISISKYEI